jgi:hypothetical protein
MDSAVSRIHSPKSRGDVVNGREIAKAVMVERIRI